MKFWKLATLSIALVFVISGCGVKTPTRDAKIDNTLPIVALTANGTIVDTSSIALEWQTISDPRVEGVYIYRMDLSKGGTVPASNDYYDTVSNRFSTHYLDTKIEPNKKYGYYFKTFSSSAESVNSAITTVTSLPPLESVSWIHATGGMPKSVKVLWRPHSNEKVKAYVIQRKTLESSDYRDVATVYGRLNAEYIDKDLKDKFTYIYRIKVLTHDNLLSNPSQEVTVVTKALPNEITQINATTTIPKKIKLTWEYTPSEGFLTYRVYRSTSINGSYSTLVDTKEKFYIDSVEEDGKEYFYRVSVFDKDKLESINTNNTVMGKTLIKPTAPSISEARVVDGRVKISWISVDHRVKSFNVEKKHKKSLFESKVTEIENIKVNEFYDADIQNGETYLYKVYGVDENKIKSEPSIEIEMKIKDVRVNKSPIPQSQQQQNSINSTTNTDRIITPPQQRTPDFKVNEPVEEVIPLNDFK